MLSCSPRRRSLVTALLLVALVLCARVRYTGSDPRVTLLTAQALLETGRPKLDPYLPPEVIEQEITAPWSIWKNRGSIYNFYPPGTAILALPAVAAARAAGLDMVKTRDDARLQILLAAALVAVSIAELGMPLPTYYLLSTWPANATPLAGLLGVLVSPGRGLLTFSPFLVVGLAGWASRRLRHEPLFLFASAWAGLQAVMVARNHDWWGGWCYGPRLLSDSLPAWFLLVLLALVRLEPHLKRPARRSAVVTALAAAAAFSIGVHTVQGLFNPATWTWNDRPNVYDAPAEKLFDVTNPQFLATWKRNDAAAEKFYRKPPTVED